VNFEIITRQIHSLSSLPLLQIFGVYKILKIVIKGGLWWQTLPGTQACGRQISAIVEAYRLVLISAAGGSIPWPLP
jgi:hypothetical protein